MLKAYAYHNFGRWVVDCPAPQCTDARAVYDKNGIRQTEDTCARGHHFQIEMPPPALEAQITAVLSERVADEDKAWYPRGHERATLVGLPTGQSVADLRAEGEEVAKLRADEHGHRQERLRQALEEAGIRVRPDGTFEGSV